MQHKYLNAQKILVINLRQSAALGIEICVRGYFNGRVLFTCVHNMYAQNRHRIHPAEMDTPYSTINPRSFATQFFCMRSIMNRTWKPYNIYVYYLTVSRWTIDPLLSFSFGADSIWLGISELGSWIYRIHKSTVHKRETLFFNMFLFSCFVDVVMLMAVMMMMISPCSLWLFLMTGRQNEAS